MYFAVSFAEAPIARRTVTLNDRYRAFRLDIADQRSVELAQCCRTEVFQAAGIARTNLRHPFWIAEYRAANGNQIEFVAFHSFEQIVQTRRSGTLAAERAQEIA